MNFLHKNNILHLDLKPDNLLVNSLYADSSCCVKITDFGTSRFTQKLNKEKGLGTPLYLSPESYRDIYTQKNDVYSFAITAWELFYAEEPYKDFKSLFEIKNYVCDGKRLEIDDTMPQEWASVIENCWKQEPESRPDFNRIVKDIGKFKNVENAKLDEGVDMDKIDIVLQERKEGYSKLFE